MKNGDPGQEQTGQDVNCGHDCQHEFEFVNGAGKVSVETEAKDLEQDFQVVEDGEADLQPFLDLKEMLARLLIWGVLETDAGCLKTKKIR